VAESEAAAEYEPPVPTLTKAPDTRSR